MEIGSKVRIKLQHITDDTDRYIDGRIGTLESNDFDPYVPYDFCVRIGGFIFGVNTNEIEEVDDKT